MMTKERGLEGDRGIGGRYPGTKLFISAECLENSRREDIYCNFAELQRRIWRKWGRFKDDTISSYKRRSHFLDGEAEREGAGGNWSSNTWSNVFRYDGSTRF